MEGEQSRKKAEEGGGKEQETLSDQLFDGNQGSITPSANPDHDGAEFQ